MSKEAIEEAVARIRAVGVPQDDDQIREALQSCNNSAEDAMQLLMPESPRDSALRSYHVITTQTSSSSYEADVDMRDTETHPGSGADSDHDSTTVSYSLDEERNIDVEEEGEGEGEGEGVKGRVSPFVAGQEEEELSEFPLCPEGLPPRYEDIVQSNQGDSPTKPPTGAPRGKNSEPEMPPSPSQSGGGSTGSIEFPLTHFYELESRVHTEQWSIPYKREESLAICMIATTKMIKEGEHSLSSCL